MLNSSYNHLKIAFNRHIYFFAAACTTIIIRKTCILWKWLDLFFVSCRNLYQPQKLLSVNTLDIEHLHVHTLQRDLEPDLDLQEFPPAKDQPVRETSSTHDMDTHAVFPIIAFLGTALVILFMLNQYYKVRSKPKRKRPRNLKKFTSSMFYGYKVPSVWNKDIPMAGDNVDISIDEEERLII